MKLRIHHRTEYRFDAPVAVGPQTLRLRPREDPWTRVLDHRLALDPEAPLRWTEDAWGNAAAIWEIRGPVDRYSVVSSAVVDSGERNPFDFILEMRAQRFPVAWTPEEEKTFARCLDPGAISGAGRLNLLSFARECARNGGDRPLEFLTTINRTINADFRFVPGSTTVSTPPDEVLARREGVCQDFTNVLLACARLMGLPARYVSGYVYVGPPSPARITASHAWAQVYLPGAGWLGLDPANGSLACDTHVAAATGYAYDDVCPVSGSYFGPSRLHQLDVEVRVEAMEGSHALPG